MGKFKTHKGYTVRTYPDQMDFTPNGNVKYPAKVWDHKGNYLGEHLITEEEEKQMRNRKPSTTNRTRYKGGKRHKR